MSSMFGMGAPFDYMVMDYHKRKEQIDGMVKYFKVLVENGMPPSMASLEVENSFDKELDELDDSEMSELNKRISAIARRYM